jgi:hypothetical protein
MIQASFISVEFNPSLARPPLIGGNEVKLGHAADVKPNCGYMKSRHYLASRLR